MAMNDSNTKGGPPAEGVTAARRLMIRLNVWVMICAAALLLIVVNVLGSIKHARKDLATYGAYGLSDRTKTILSERAAEPITISMLYEDADRDEKQAEYVARLEDYLLELKEFAPEVKVQRYKTESQKESLGERLREMLGGEGKKHAEALDAFKKLGSDVEADLGTRLSQLTAILNADSWLSDFPSTTQALRRLQLVEESFKNAAEEIAALTPQKGIPKYAEAVQRATTALTEVKDHFDKMARQMSELSALADEMAKPDAPDVKVLATIAQRTVDLAGQLRAAAGNEGDPLPAQPGTTLKEYADKAEAVGRELSELVRQADSFAKKYPSVKTHNRWSTRSQMGGLVVQMEIAAVLERLGRELRDIRLKILGVIDKNDAQEMASALTVIRRYSADLETDARVCGEMLGGLSQRLARLDEPSKLLLAEARGANLFRDRIQAIEALEKQIKELPELKQGSVADQLKQRNQVVVEINNRVRVLSFDEVFTLRESVGGRSFDQDKKEEEEEVRIFNGDSAIASAIQALSVDRPFATVVFVAYEPPAPPQRGPFSPPPPQSAIPVMSLTELRSRLEAANFKVVDWNLATTQEPPKPEEGTQNVYVILPPAPPAEPNPFQQQPEPQKSFGEAEMKLIQNILDADGRALFLATWDVQRAGPFGNTYKSPAYGYAPMLDGQWGIQLKTNRRVIWVLPDRQDPEAFGVEGTKFNYMPLTGFEDHEIGKPMRGTRFLATDVCPLAVRSELPPGVTVRSVATIPESDNYLAADLNELIRIVDEVRNPSRGGLVKLNTKPVRGPFPVVLAAERKEGDKTRGRIVVVGFGRSVSDGYLKNEVFVDQGRLRSTPPPTESADLVVNSLFWLQGQVKRISRGPVPTPRLDPITKQQANTIRALSILGWPLAICIPGVFLWFIRRR